MPHWSLQTSFCNVLPNRTAPKSSPQILVFSQAFSTIRCPCKVNSHSCKDHGQEKLPWELLSFGRSSELCNADYYRRQVIFSVLSNSSHWGKKTGQHFISITKGRREDSIEREPFCQRAMASLFGTVSRGTRINISCLQLLWVGRGKSDSSRQSQEYSQTRSTAPLQARPSLFAQTKWRGRTRSSNKYLIIALISNCNFTVEGEQCLCLLQTWAWLLDLNFVGFWRFNSC